ncbi:MAG: response regulator [Rhodoferax sp.]|nr:response regulator [Rhodoferax sp.]
MPSPCSVLLVEDDLALSGYLASSLIDAGYAVQSVSHRAEAGVRLALAPQPQLMLLDLGLPPHASGMAEGLAVLDDALQKSPAIKVIVLTGQDEDAAALEAIRRGAFDFLVKPASLASIHSALSRAKLFNHAEGRMTAAGEARLHLTARLWEGPKEAASSAEEQLLRRTWVAAGYNVAEVARQLGMAREHVYYYLNKYGLRRPD